MFNKGWFKAQFAILKVINREGDYNEKNNDSFNHANIEHLAYRRLCFQY